MAEVLPWQMDWGAKAAPAPAAPKGEELPWEMDWDAAMTRESRERQDQIVSTIEGLMGEQGEQVDKMMVREDLLRQIEQDAASQRAALQEQGLLEESRDAQDQYLAEVEEQQRILRSILNQASSGADVALQMAAERQLMERSRARQDQVLKALTTKAAPRKKAIVPRGTSVKQLEAQLRDLRKRERIAGQLSADAADRRDKAAWERAGKILDKLFDEREQVLRDIRKANPKRADELYDELYIR